MDVLLGHVLFACLLWREEVLLAEAAARASRVPRLQGAGAGEVGQHGGLRKKTSQQSGVFGGIIEQVCAARASPRLGQVGCVAVSPHKQHLGKPDITAAVARRG
jgi:hypothetical protein